MKVHHAPNCDYRGIDVIVCGMCGYRKPRVCKFCHRPYQDSDARCPVRQIFRCEPNHTYQF